MGEQQRAADPARRRRALRGRRSPALATSGDDDRDGGQGDEGVGQAVLDSVDEGGGDEDEEAGAGGERGGSTTFPTQWRQAHVAAASTTGNRRRPDPLTRIGSLAPIVPVSG